MAQASKAKRRLRRIKRERTLAFRLVDRLIGQRNEARDIANFMAKQVELRDNPAPAATEPTDETVSPELTLAEAQSQILDAEIALDKEAENA